MSKAGVLGIATAMALCAVCPAQADIERKVTITCDAQGKPQICWAIWPALPEMPGWHRDEDASFKYGANILVPDGAVFRNAPTALSGNAVFEEDYETGHPGPNLLDSFIADDLDNTRKENPDVVVAEQEPAASADGVKMRTFTFRKLKDGHSQILCYGEDADKDDKFFIVLMMDSTIDKAFETDLPLFRQMVAKYKHWSAK